MTADSIKTILSNLFKEKSKKYLFAAAAFGFVLVLLSSFISSSEKKSEVNDNSCFSVISEYCSQQEQRLEKILASIDGVGTVHVMMTLENGIEYRYAADEKQSGDSVLTYADGSGSPSKVQESEISEQNYILIGSSGDKKPLVVTEISPRVKGVVVVCDGGSNPVIIHRITDAVTTALGINSLQVCVAKASKQY